jgi:glycerol uptake facilitator-like aquaporin
MRFFENIDFYGMKVEFIGTFAVVYCGGWAWMNYTFKNCTIMEVAFTHFLVYTLFVWSGYLFSGALYNPALTALMMMFKKISMPKGTFYLTAQLLGCLLAASLLQLISPDS